MLDLSESKKEQISDLITKQKKAKINWVLTVTQTSFEELESIAKELGFIIKGEYIALESEAEKISEKNDWKPIRTLSEEEMKLSIIKFCPICGNPIKDSDREKEFTGHCSNCGADLVEFSSEETKSDYFQKRCQRCGNFNSVKVKYCIFCSSNKLKRVTTSENPAIRKIPAKAKPLATSQFIIFTISFIISVGVIIFAAIDITSQFGTLAPWLAVVLIIIGALIFFLPMYFIYRLIIYFRYVVWYGEEDAEL